MNELQTNAQFKFYASRKPGQTSDLCRGTERGMSFVLLDDTHFFGERDSLT